jgi:hypothetical protein
LSETERRNPDDHTSMDAARTCLATFPGIFLPSNKMRVRIYPLSPGRQTFSRSYPYGCNEEEKPFHVIIEEPIWKDKKQMTTQHNIGGSI